MTASGLEHPCYAEPVPRRSDDGRLLCETCGADQRINEQTGNVLWFRNGRLIANVQDLADAKDRHERTWGTRPGG